MQKYFYFCRLQFIRMQESLLKSRNFWLLNLTIFVWGFTGILGKLISFGAIELVWYRVLIASISLGIYFLITGFKLQLSLKLFLQLFCSGAVIAAHWILFFHSIKISTVSVGLVCLSSATLFTSIIEPLLKREKIAVFDMVIGCIIILGIYLIFKFESKYTLGIICGLLAAVLSSIYSSLCSLFSSRAEPKSITFSQLVGALFWISLYRIIEGSFDHDPLQISVNDGIALLILGTLCTAVAFVISVKVMKQFNAFTVILYTNLEPIYGIIIAYFMFGETEKMSLGFYMGTLIILTSVFSYPFLKRNTKKLQNYRKKTA